MLKMRFLKLGSLKSLQEENAQKRKRSRTKSLNLIKSATYTGNAKEQISNLMDLSEEGLQFFSKEKIEPNTVLKITVNLAEKGKQIPIIVKVLWTHPVKGKGTGHLVGGSFLEIDPKDRSLISDFIKQQEKQFEID